MCAISLSPTRRRFLATLAATGASSLLPAHLAAAGDTLPRQPSKQGASPTGTTEKTAIRAFRVDSDKASITAQLTKGHGQSGLRYDRRWRRRNGLGGDLRVGAPRPARPRARTVQHPARAWIIRRLDPHLSLRLFRGPELRAVDAPVFRALAGARARFWRDPAHRNRRSRYRAAVGPGRQRCQGGMPHTSADARGAPSARCRAAVSGLAAAPGVRSGAPVRGRLLDGGAGHRCARRSRAQTRCRRAREGSRAELESSR